MGERGADTRWCLSEQPQPHSEAWLVLWGIFREAGWNHMSQNRPTFQAFHLHFVTFMAFHWLFVISLAKRKGCIWKVEERGAFGDPQKLLGSSNLVLYGEFPGGGGGSFLCPVSHWPDSTSGAKSLELPYCVFHSCFFGYLWEWQQVRGSRPSGGYAAVVLLGQWAPCGGLLSLQQRQGWCDSEGSVVSQSAMEASRSRVGGWALTWGWHLTMRGVEWIRGDKACDELGWRKVSPQHMWALLIPHDRTCPSWIGDVCHILCRLPHFAGTEDDLDSNTLTFFFPLKGSWDV